MHKLLERQLKKLYGSLDRVPRELADLLAFVDDSYRQADDDRTLLERSLDLTSRELLEANAELRRDRQALERRVEERAADLLRVNASLEREIAEREEAETALRQSERRYQILAFHSPAGILHSDARGRCLYVNKKWCEMAGTSTREALGDGWLDSLHPGDRARVSSEWRRAVARRLPVFSSEFRFRRQDREVFWVVAQAVAIRGDDGGTAGYVLTATDITERRKAEQAILRSEERYRTLFEDSKDTIYMSTPEGRLLDVNPAGVDLFGYASKEEFLAGEDGLRLPIEDADRDELLRRLESDGFVQDMELSARRRDGTELVLLATVTPVTDKHGRIESVRGILRDVTQQRRLERSLIQAQKLEAVGRLAGGVAHDFNNLLTAIIGYGELTRMLLAEDDPAAEHLRQIDQAGRRGARLTQQLLAFSRRQMLEPRALDLNRAVAEMESLLRRLIGEDIELVTRLEEGIGSLRADPGQLEQVILNLAVNARDAMPDGGRLLLETYEREVAPGDHPLDDGIAPGRYIALAVEDSGIGMDETVREQIFEPFFTTKHGSRGTGLGLSTVYGIVSQSGGAVECTSQPGQGARFVILLPRTEEASSGESDGEAQAEPPRGKETLLLAEDEPAVRSFLATFLRQQGYRVLTAEDGQEALQVSAESDRPIDLLLSDVVMPRLNGIQLAERLRAERPGLKVILMSGHTGSRAGVTDMEDERTLFLRKPFTTRDLALRLRELLDSGGASGVAAAG